VNASALLDELRGAGIRLHRDGDDLIAHVLPGVSLDPFRERIQQCRPALLREVSHREHVAALTAEPTLVNRQPPDPDEAIAALVAHLESGWAWLVSHPDHPEHEPFLARWLAKLREYERAFTAQHQRGDGPCLPS